MVRLHIVGGGGSGKSTLGAVLGQRLGRPVYHLDEVLWPRGPDGAATMGAAEWHAFCDREIARIAALPAWIVEGGYPGWIDELVERADLVVWPDVPFWRAAYRIVRRHVLADLRGNNPHPGYRNLIRFLRGKYAYYTESAETYHARVAAPPPGANRWSGAYYTRAHLAAQHAAGHPKLLRLTHGSPHEHAQAVLARLSQAWNRARPGMPPDA